MKSKSIDIKIINSSRIRPKRIQTFRELQLTFLNSLAKNPLIRLNKKRKKFPEDFDDYISKMDNSLKKYQLTYIKKDDLPENEIGSNQKYITKDDTKLIKKIYDKNRLNYSNSLSPKKEESNLKVVVTSD